MQFAHKSSCINLIKAIFLEIMNFLVLKTTDIELFPANTHHNIM